MFPPKVTSNPEQMLGNLCASLARAAENLSSGSYEPLDGGKFSASIRLLLPMTDTMKSSASSYIREYAKASGWRVSVRIGRDQVRIEGKAASKPSSRASRNRRDTRCGSSK